MRSARRPGCWLGSGIAETQQMVSAYRLTITAASVACVPSLTYLQASEASLFATYFQLAAVLGQGTIHSSMWSIAEVTGLHGWRTTRTGRGGVDAVAILAMVRT